MVERLAEETGWERTYWTEEELGVDPTKPWHTCLMSPSVADWDYDVIEHHPVHFAAKIREYTEELPPSQGRFRLSEVLDDEDGIEEYAIPNTSRRLAEIAGSWRVPEPYSRSEQAAARYVNPNYTHLPYYSQVWSRCACGALMVQSKPKKTAGEVVQVEHDHDACTRQQRLRARAELLDSRKEVAERILHDGHSISSMRGRLGMNGDSLHAPESIGLNLQEAKAEGRRRMARTAARLARYYTTKEIAAAYGVSGSFIGRLIRECTDKTALELQAIRHENRDD